MTSLAFQRSMVPSALLFVLKTHLTPNTLEAVEGGTRDHVPVERRALYSFDMVCRQSRSFDASVKLDGSSGIEVASEQEGC